MRVLFVAAEAYPLAKTGGLADATAGLAGALAQCGLDVRVLLPAYRSVRARTDAWRPLPRFRPHADFPAARLIETRLPESGVATWLLDCPELYDRPGGPYQDEAARPWPDNARRFAFLSHAAAALALGGGPQGWRPDIVHAHDWHAGLAPLFLARAGRERPATVFTIHNLAFLGQFPRAAMAACAIPPELFAVDGLEFHGDLSLLKAGLAFADRCTTVSPSYAREVMTPEFGCGLDGLMQNIAGKFSGILNGVDHGVWDPARDPFIPQRYSAADLTGKIACKAALQTELGLRREARTPLIAFLSRLTHQKMADLLPTALGDIVGAGAQFALLGCGDPAIEAAFRAAARGHAGQVSVRTGYDEPSAHRLLAGADMVLAPARFEPCGLTQLYGLRYGTVPIVRRTGGLRDTVVDADDESRAGDRATGFVFERPEPGDLVAAVRRACGVYRASVAWRRIQRRAMAQDFGWNRSAAAYLELYRGLAPAAVADSARPAA